MRLPPGDHGCSARVKVTLGHRVLVLVFSDGCCAVGHRVRDEQP